MRRYIKRYWREAAIYYAITAVLPCAVIALIAVTR